MSKDQDQPKARRGRPPGTPNPNAGRPKGTTKSSNKIQVSLRLRRELVIGMKLLAEGEPEGTENQIWEAALDEHIRAFLPDADQRIRERLHIMSLHERA